MSEIQYFEKHALISENETVERFCELLWEVAQFYKNSKPAGCICGNCEGEAGPVDDALISFIENATKKKIEFLQTANNPNPNLELNLLSMAGIPTE
jgi:hypothetical protein